MKGSFRKRGCKCPKDRKKCTCGATWSFRIDLGLNPKTGKRRQIEKYGFKTKADAEAAAAALLTEYKQGTYVEEKDMLFKEFAEKWIKTYEASGKVKQSTVDIRRAKLKLLLDHFQYMKIKNITKRMYQELLDDLLKQKFARKTIASVHETGSLLFKKAAELEIIKSDPTQYAQVPIIRKSVEELEQEHAIPKYLEKEELARFLQIAQRLNEECYYAVFLTLAYTGMRVGELVALKWKDIDFEQQTISITKTIYYTGKKTTDYIFQPPKTLKSVRKIEVDQFVLDELDQHREKQPSIQTEFVFAKEKGKYRGHPVMVANVETHMTRYLKYAKLNEDLTPHSLRHTHTSLLAEAGVRLETIQERLGHKSDTMTKAIYLHVTKSQKKEASEKFAELMRNITTSEPNSNPMWAIGGQNDENKTEGA